MNLKKLLLASLIILILFNNSHSQNISKDTLLLDEVVITATKTLRSIKEVPGRALVIDQEEIRSTPAQQLDDILRFIPGLNVNRSTGMFSQRPMVTLRGLSGDEQSRTLVLINGVPVNTSDEGGVNWNRINPYDIDRIEVFKGPGSSLYGNNAMGGVINILTKRPLEPQEIYGGISYGTFNTLRQDLNVRIRNNNGFYGSVSQYYLKSDGYNNIPEPDRTPYDIKRSLEEVSLSARAGYDNSNWFKWELQYDVFRDKRGEGYQIYVPGGVYRNFNTNLFRGNLRGGNDRTNYDLNLFYQLEHYYDVNERMRGPNYSRYDVDSDRKDWGALFSLNHQLTRNNTLTGGIEFKKGSIEGGDYYQTAPFDTVFNAGNLQTIAGYLQDEHGFFNNKIRLIAGLRYDRVKFGNGDFFATNPWNNTTELEDHTWSEFSPRAGLRFNFIKEVSSYISYSHGFRASILDDLTRTGWMWVGPKYANPELGPESMNNYEIGFDFFPGQNLKVSASAFNSIGRDFLYYVATADSLFGRPVYRRENVTNVNIKGAEFDIEYNPFPNLNILGSYTFNDSKIEAFSERPLLEDKYLKYVPKHIASASVFWKNKWVNTSFRGLYKGEQFGDDANTIKLDSYFTFDMQLSKTIMENYIVSLDIQDIFDNENMETINYISPGRIIMLRAAVNF